MHARGQVAHFDAPSQACACLEGQAVRRLARLLPPDVRVKAACKAPADFDARFSALWRRYSYRVSDDPIGVDPLRRHDTVAYRRPLDVVLMNVAASALVGEHDFAAFCKRREGATSIRRLIQMEWARDSETVAVATVVANAFCHNMVRALVGAMFAVGDGRQAGRVAGRGAGQGSKRFGGKRGTAAWALPRAGVLPARQRAGSGATAATGFICRPPASFE